VQYNASFFSFRCPPFSLRSSSSFLHRLPHLPVTSILHSVLPPINPTLRPYLGVLWIRTLPRVTWEAVQLWRVYPDEGCYDTRWLTGLWSTQAKMEGFVLKAAWHWGSNCSVINDPLGEPDRTQLYVGLPFTWGSVDGDQIFSPFFGGRLLIGDFDRYKWMNKPLALEMKLLSP
jgi:hypothetical protein